MKEVMQGLSLLEASLNGWLDSLELDNTCDVIEKSDVRWRVKDLLKQVKQTQNKTSK